MTGYYSYLRLWFIDGDYDFNFYAALFGFINTAAFLKICQQLINSDYEERLKTENLSSTRAKLIVMSVLLIKFVHQKIECPNLVVSDHTMREGLVYELLES
jgi:exopolyphosphatase/pppGpp-phosphohydrolase